MGQLHEAHHAALKGLSLSRLQENQYQEAISLNVLGNTLAASGVSGVSDIALRRAIRIDSKRSDPQGVGLGNSWLAQCRLLSDASAQAQQLAQHAWILAQVDRFEKDCILAARLQGAAALELGDLAAATERLHHALTRARAVSYVEEELPALTALAEMRRRQSELDKAREHLDAVWEPALRGPYPMLHADACNVLARIENDSGNRDAAVQASTRAYELAWCDGPPYAYAYAYGLKHAKKLLADLGVPEPECEPFDESNFEPLPDVEINPKDEFWVDPDGDSTDE